MQINELLTYDVSDYWLSNLMGLAKASDTYINHNDLHPSLLTDIKSCYDYCNKVTAYHSKSFYLASKLLPPEKRNAIRALYAFCRTTDDIIDMSGDNKSILIEKWKDDIIKQNVRYNDPVSIAWFKAVKDYQIPTRFSIQLIEGVQSDLYKKRYENFGDLAQYCYAVASTVGLMSMHIVGFYSDEALEYAIQLGVALQLTNILRDIEEDYQRGRIYLPQDEMGIFGITEDHFKHRILDENWKSFIQFQIHRNRKIYEDAWPGIKMLNKDGRLAIAAAASFYRKILDVIERNDYNVFNQRAAVSKWGKIRQLPDLLIKYKYAESFNSFLS